MKSYEFIIVADGLPIDGDDWHDRFYEAGCDDAVLTVQRGLFVLHFDREANTFAEAIESACADVVKAGANIVRIEPDPLVSASDIAERSNITRQAVSLYVKGERGEGFPKPVACISGSRPMWKWSEVAEWLQAAGKLDANAVEFARLVDKLNATGFGFQEAAAEPAPVISAFARMDFYIREPIDKPILRTVSSTVTERHRSGFSLRPQFRTAEPMRSMVQ